MIRNMKREDLDAVLEIENTVFTSPWPLKEYEYELEKNPYANPYVFEQDGKIVGYFDYWILYEKAEIANIAVDPNYQKQGIGQLMMDALVQACIENGCETISLEVRVSNTPAISFYEKNGFIQVNIRKGYYADNHEDAYLMVKPIGGLL